MADRAWKGIQPLLFERFCQLSLNKFFDMSTPFMRKVDNEEKNVKNGIKPEDYVVYSGH